MDNKIEKYWNDFINYSTIDSTKEYADVFYFGSHESSANQLLNLVLSGKKTATCSSLEAYKIQGEPLPKLEDYCIITNWQGEPKGIIKTINIEKMKFEDMTFDICKREGEDKTLESWQNNHIYFFKAEGEQLGYEFSWDMEIIFEDFELVYS